MGVEELTPMLVNWGLSETLCYLRHLELRGEVEKVEGEDPERWRATLASASHRRARTPSARPPGARS